MTKTLCPLPWQQMVVGITGIAVPCCYRPWPEAFGNLKTQNVHSIWNGPRYVELRKAMVEGGIEAACPDCQIIPVQGIPPLMKKPEFMEDKNTPYAANMTTVEDEFSAGATTLAARPTMFTISPSGRCNIVCPHCSQHENHLSKEEVGDNAWAAIRDLTPTLDYLNWGGGEPTIQPEFRRFLESGLPEQAPQLTIAMISNGLLLKQDLVRRLAGFRKTTLQVSIDAGTKEVYEKVRWPAKWEVLQRNLRDMIELERTQKGFWVVGSYTINKSNVLSIVDYIALCRELGLPSSFYSVWHYPPEHRPDLFNDVDAETVGWEEEFRQAREDAHRYDAEAPPTCIAPDGSLYTMTPFLERYLGIIEAGMAEALGHIQRSFSFGAACAGRFVLVRRQSDRRAVAYGTCGKDGTVTARVPMVPLRLEIWENGYLHQRIALAHCDDPLDQPEVFRMRFDEAGVSGVPLLGAEPS